MHRIPNFNAHLITYPILLIALSIVALVILALIKAHWLVFVLVILASRRLSLSS